ncbi:hypothetical protein EJ02DRAFT_470734 [Clathrospora elynae]|uniref:Uncharacterized protein n=1 Tax=Clathrospora elynae TaxID=706981 RepID=A0A6A5S9B6_9PLEO|nr:hypothetical protein EJ02DRAFT_470734 [Clathrospora elynae]
MVEFAQVHGVEFPPLNKGEQPEREVGMPLTSDTIPSLETPITIPTPDTMTDTKLPVTISQRFTNPVTYIKARSANRSSRYTHAHPVSPVSHKRRSDNYSFLTSSETSENFRKLWTRSSRRDARNRTKAARVKHEDQGGRMRNPVILCEHGHRSAERTKTEVDHQVCKFQRGSLDGVEDNNGKYVGHNPQACGTATSSTLRHVGIAATLHLQLLDGFTWFTSALERHRGNVLDRFLSPERAIHPSPGYSSDLSRTSKA